MLISDTHLHSFFSSDSEASMEDMILQKGSVYTPEQKERKGISLFMNQWSDRYMHGARRITGGGIPKTIL